ncbi:PDZ domain-containing protein, partial [Pseudorhodobacter sp.]|uniref:PDZ domain-containing protein n=1 Tax=Pseudorhodobacter sp. TaxID=1934400 RepID=UPI002648C6B2
SLSLRVLRGGVEIAILLPLRRPPADVLGMRGMDGSAIPKRITAYRLMDLGITLDDNAGNTARIRNVTQNSPALFAGIIAGDSILAINSKALTEQELARIVIDAPALVLLRRAGGATLHVILNPWDTGEGVRPVGGANVLDPAIIVF